VIHRLLMLTLVMAALAGCSHKTLIAPCDGKDVTPIEGGNYVAPTSDCGPMKPVNG
jgi:hypothetical protein